jgi:hypothetical protein
MKKFWEGVVSTLIILAFLVAAGKVIADTTQRILSDAYPIQRDECTQDSDADPGEHNRLGPFTAGKRYLVYGHDGSGEGAPVECLWGDVTVNAAATNTEGEILFKGEKVLYRADEDYNYISCVPFTANYAYDVCPRN